MMRCSFHPLTDVLYSLRDKSRVYQYYGCVEGVEAEDDKKDENEEESLNASQCRRSRVVVGDLYAYYKDDNGKNSKRTRSSSSSSSSDSVKARQSRASIGQILALFSSRKMDGDCTYHAVVRKLLRQSATNEHSLLETVETETIELDQIWNNVKIRLLVISSSIYDDDSNHKKKQQQELGLHSRDDGSLVWTFDQVYGQIKKDKTLSLPIKDWRNYQISWTTEDEDNSYPSPLTRGWSNLSDANLRKALITKMRSCLQTLNIEEQRKKEHPSSSSVSSSKQQQISHNQVVKQRGTKRGSAQTSSAISSSNSGTKRRRSSDDDDDDECSHMAQINAPSHLPKPDCDKKRFASRPAAAPAAVIIVTPLSKVVHKLRTSKAIKVTHPLQFYTQVQVSTDTSAWSIQRPVAARAAPSPPLNWTISVGDLLIVTGRRDDGKTSTSRAAKSQRKSTWYPFAVPWSVGQVLSLYQVQVEELEGNDSQKDNGDDDASSSSEQEAGGWRMELRWFYHPHELASLGIALPTPPEDDPNYFENDTTLIEVDEHVTAVPIQAAVGRAQIISSLARRHNEEESDDEHGYNNTSSSSPSAFFDENGTLVASLVCNHIYMSEYDERTLRKVSDWEGRSYGSNLKGPLSRGLACEKAWPGRPGCKRLQKAYKQFLIRRYQLKNTLVDNGLTDVHAGNSLLRATITRPGEGGHSSWQWPSDLLESGSNVIIDSQNTRVLCRSKGLEFLQSVLIPTCHKRCDPRTTATKSYSPLWKLTVGDYVCLADDRSSHPPAGKRSPWFPFLGPWSVVQILCIYRRSNDAASDILLEVRRFVRPEELPARVRSWLPPSLTGDDEVFETETVEKDVRASKALGLCVIRGANGLKAAAATTMTNANGGPQVRRCVRFLYLATLERLLPVFGKTSTSWSKNMLERGLRRSSLIQDDASLAEGIEFCLNVKLGNNNPLEKLFASLPTDQVQPQPLWRKLYWSVPVDPQWHVFDRLDLLCSHEDRSNLKWVVRLGDVVVARSQSDQQGCSNYNWFPFTSPWKVCQVLAILSNSGGPPDKVMVRWLESRVPRRDSTDIGWVYEVGDCHEPDICSIDVTDVFGPVSLVTDDSSNQSLSNSGPVFLPITFVQYNVKSLRGVTFDCREMLRTLVKRGIDMCPEYENAERSKVMSVLGEESGAAGMDLSQPLRNERPRRAAASRISESKSHSPGAAVLSPSSKSARRSAEIRAGPPLLVDPGTGVKFYSELSVTPPIHVFGDELAQTLRGSPPSWKVKLGDTVALQYYADGSKKQKRTDLLPFLVPWAVAEIVTIFESSQRTNDSAAVNEQDRHLGGIRMEVRWFYHAREMSSSAVGKVCYDISNMDEVFETDHFHVACPSSILAPVLLHDNTKPPCPEIEQFCGATVLHFSCHQFWSYHRKSLIPAGSLKGRVSRGRAHSLHFGKYDVLQSACERLEQPKKESSLYQPGVPPSFESAFQRVIEKLSLTDASKEAIHNASGIIGRESERKSISTFLRTAVSGPMTEGSSSTLFVAGPPGVGKTACVRAAINELRRVTSTAMRLDFDCVLLNGMELRHPFDAYSKLWEEVSPDKEKCSADTAAARLENYFTSKDSGGRPGNSRVVVVLVDELDYLVTKKQTVLYDFFDWPSRSNSDRRLVVIGVSNTLNLPERLHPRVQSRIGSKRCYFKSYNQKEISAIIKAKVNQASPEYEVFDDDAITFASKKTAALSGDIRKAFRFCRAAAEMILSDLESGVKTPGPPKVRIKDVLKVSREGFNSAQTKGIALCCPFEALFLVALASLSKITGRERGGFDVEEIMTKMEGMANALGNRRYLPSPNLDEVLELAARLGEARLISLRTPRNASMSYRTSLSGSGGPWPLVSMVMEDSTILVAFKDTENRELAQKYLVNTCG